jgi:hypothetical protein
MFKTIEKFLIVKSSFFSANLSGLVYQHTLTALALPIKLVLPTVDIAQDYRPIANQQQETKKMSVKDLLEKGAGKIKYNKKK